MSSLTDIEKRYLEKILKTGDGYVLDYSDATFGKFFRQHRVNIHGQKYQTYGTSKAKKLRSFWEQESDALVGQVLSEMLDAYEADCDLNGGEVEESVLGKARGIVARLLGESQKTKQAETVDGFLEKEFTIPNIQGLPIEQTVVPIIESRLAEAQKESALFNRSPASPKTEEDKVRQFQDWTLANFIKEMVNLCYRANSDPV